MKTEGKVRRRLKQAQYRHLQKMLRVHFKQTPEKCTHGVLHAVPKFVSTSPIGENWRLCGVQCAVVCNDAIAKDCDLFEPFEGKEAIKQQFNEFLLTEDIGIIAEKYLDLAALLWVLGAEAPSDRLNFFGPQKQISDEEAPVPEPSQEVEEVPKQIVTGSVIYIGDESAFISLPEDVEGYIQRGDLCDEDGAWLVAVGDIVEAEVWGVDPSGWHLRPPTAIREKAASTEEALDEEDPDEETPGVVERGGYLYITQKHVVALPPAEEVLLAVPNKLPPSPHLWTLLSGVFAQVWYFLTGRGGV